jgi:flavin-dependent dehydrogenase
VLECVAESERAWESVSEGDVVVIGASTAGLFSAYLLAQQGLRVRLFDQHQRLGPPQRTLIVTSQICQALGFVPHEAVVNHIQEIELLSQNRRAVVSLGAPDLVLERERLVRLLATKAQREGVEIGLGHTFTELAQNADGLNVALHNRSTDKATEVKARVLIGADGICSEVASAVGAGRRAARHDAGRVTILQARVILPPGTSEHTVRVWFHKESTQFFYWLIPESQVEGVAGLACEDQEQARNNLGQFLDANGLEALEFQMAEVALFHPGRPASIRLGSSEVFLVGDAGGQVKVTTIGGVVAGLRGARSAAESICAWSDGREGHERNGAGALRRELGLHFLMRCLLNRFGNSDYDHLLELLGSRAKGVLRICTRDELDRALLKLLLAQPRLLLLAARSLVRSGDGKCNSAGQVRTSWLHQCSEASGEQIH